MLLKILFIILLLFSTLQSLQDIRTMKVSLYLQILAIFSMLIPRCILNFGEFYLYIISVALFFIVYFLARKITNGKFGVADVIFGVFQGMCLLPSKVPVCIAVEVVVAFLWILLTRVKKTKLQPIPFIPFMSVGLIVAFLL